MSDKEGDGEQPDAGQQDPGNPDVTTKYRCAGGIVNEALQAVIAACIPGADIVDICKLGDQIIVEKTAKMYNKKEKGRKIEKGIAFPTCVSINEICGHFSPLQHELKKLEAGDVAKIDLGCHIDGYVCVGGHTIAVGEGPIKGRRADVLKAAWTASMAALRSIKPGNKNTQVTKVIEASAKQFKCTPIHGVLSHQMKRHVIDGNQCIANTLQPDEKVEEFEFGLNEVYGIDIIMSTGEGKGRETEYRTTVFKRAVETSYSLKTPLARSFVGEVNRRFPTLPFTIRAIEDERACLLGVNECMRHELLHPYPVLSEKQGEFVAQFKFTVLILPGGTKKITGLPFDQEASVESEYRVEDEALRTLLAIAANPNKKKKKHSTKESAEMQTTQGELSGSS